MTGRQTRLDGTLLPLSPSERRVPFRTDYEGYERWRRQWRSESGEKRENTVGVHRLAAVAWSGVEALRDESVVHHRNGIPWDNRESNLRVMDRREHSLLHNRDGSGGDF